MSDDMTALSKKKLCWNCEGRVSPQEENCPFCGVYISGTLHMQGSSPEEEEAEAETEVPLLDESQAHAPLYTPIQEAVKEAVPLVKAPKEPKLSLPAVSTPINLEFLPVVLLITGSVFFFFSLVLALFSHEGVFTLQWDATFWFVYLIIALPALFFGWRLLQKDSPSDIS